MGVGEPHGTVTPHPPTPPVGGCVKVKRRSQGNVPSGSAQLCSFRGPRRIQVPHDLDRKINKCSRQDGICSDLLLGGASPVFDQVRDPHGSKCTKRNFE